MYGKTVIIAFVFIFITNLVTCDESNMEDAKSRQKRFALIWHEPEASNWVQLIVGIGIPIEVQHNAITLGSVLKAYYKLPTNSTIYTHPTITTVKKKRSLSTRWMAYSLIENYIERNNFGDGKACMLRAICEVASQPFEEKSGIMAEIAHAFLTPSSTNEEVDNYIDNEYYAAEKLGNNIPNCSRLFNECKYDFITKFSTFLTRK